MKKFTFYKDEQITIWERTAFVVEAKSQEYAEEKVGNDPYFWIKRGTIADIHAYDFDECDAE